MLTLPVKCDMDRKRNAKGLYEIHFSRTKENASRPGLWYSSITMSMLVVLSCILGTLLLKSIESVLDLRILWSTRLKI